jgi:[ribosomal protein S5]-alanine N-acetyltransferase
MHPAVIRLTSASLRPITAADADSLARYANDRRVSIHLRDRFPFPYSPSDAIEFIAFLEADDQQMHWGIDVGGEIVGGIGLGIRADVERLTAELGYWLGVPFWGRGIVPEAVRVVTDIGHQERGLVRIFAKTYAGNVRSERVLEKAGYLREGLMRSAVIKEGRILDATLFAHVVAREPTPAD